MIPVSVLTGFLGSGKTTLLAQLLRDPGMARTAVIINEFGDIALDHELIETSDESFVQLSTGCLCCRVRSDLVDTLMDLAQRRSAGHVLPFERVVIETSGLADPAPILHALMTDRGLAEHYALGGVVTTVDAVTGSAALDAQPEALRQAAVADRLVLTKTDLVATDVPALMARLASLNATAPVLRVVQGRIAPDDLFGDDFGARVRGLPITPTVPAALHRDDLVSFSLVRDAPLRGVTLALLLSALAENCGADLLRMKGIVQVVERPEQPAVIHGVQHVYFAPQWLPRWSSADRRSRFVFIGRRVREAWVRNLIELLDDEVMEAAARAVHAGAG